MTLDVEDLTVIQNAQAKMTALEAKKKKILAVAEEAIRTKEQAIAEIQKQREIALSNVSALIAEQQAIIDGYADKAVL